MRFANPTDAVRKLTASYKLDGTDDALAD